jgi:hypothetical protein
MTKLNQAGAVTSMAFCAAMAIIAPQVAHAQNVASSAALEARLKHLKNFGIATVKSCEKQKDGSWPCETKQYATMCYIRFQCKNYPYDAKTGKITGDPLPQNGTGYEHDDAVPPRDKMPPVIDFLGIGRICDNRRMPHSSQRGDGPRADVAIGGCPSAARLCVDTRERSIRLRYPPVRACDRPRLDNRRPAGLTCPQQSKSFLVLFFKKELLPSCLIAPKSA